MKIKSLPDRARLLTEPSQFASGPVNGVSPDANLRTRELQQLFALSPSLLCIAGLDGYFKLVNPAFHKILGYTETDLMSVPFIEFVHPDDRESTISEVSKLSTGIPAVHFENRYRHADGSYRWLLWNTTPVPQEKLLYATALDITEKKKSEEGNRELLNAIPDSVIVTDQQGRVIGVNRATDTMFGYASDELVGQSIEVLLLTETCGMGWQHLSFYSKLSWPQLITGDSDNELFGFSKDGSKFPVEISLGSTEDNVICIVRNISKRLQREHDLQESALTIAADEQKLQTLATQVVLAEENERRRIACGLHDNVSQELLAAKLSVDRIIKREMSPEEKMSVKQTQDLLDNAFQSTRTLTFELSSAALYEVGLVAALQSLCERVQQQSGIYFQPPEDLLRNLIPEEMKVILYRASRELIQNVVKHSGARIAKVSLSWSDNLIRLSVEDDGVGFDVAKRYQNKHAFTGFGLFSIDQQLRLIGGKLEFESASETGTRAMMIIPIDHRGEGA